MSHFGLGVLYFLLKHLDIFEGPVYSVFLHQGVITIFIKPEENLKGQ